MRDSFFFFFGRIRFGWKNWNERLCIYIKCEEWVEMNLDSREKIRRN